MIWTLFDGLKPLVEVQTDANKMFLSSVVLELLQNGEIPTIWPWKKPESVVNIIEISRLTLNNFANVCQRLPELALLDPAV